MMPTWDALHAILPVEAKRFGPHLTDDELKPVITELVETLIRPNIGEYISSLDEVRRRFDFALLSEHEDAEGGIYLNPATRSPTR
jgi:hypothetical protein